MKTIKNLKAEEIRKSILQLAIQGKLVKQDPDDEPASELVKRIYAEKQKLIQEGKIKKDKNESFIFKGDDNCYYEKIGKNEPVKLDDLPFDIPDNWTWVRLKDIIQIQTGASFKKEQSIQEHMAGLVRVLRGGNILPFQYLLKSDDLYIPKDLVSDNILLKKNDLITPAVTSLDNIGKIAVIDAELSNTTAGGFVYIFRPYLNDDVMSNLIADFVSSLAYQSMMKGITKKSGQAFYNMNKEKLLQLYFPIAPLNEMKCIIEKVNKSVPLIMEYSITEEKLSKLEQEFPEKLKKSILQYAIEGKLVKQDPNDEPASVLLERIKAEKEKLIKEGKIKRDKNESFIYQGDDKNYYENLPTGWCVSTYSKILLEAFGGGTQSKAQPAYWGGNIKWCSVKDLGNNLYVNHTIDSITEEGLNNSSANIVKKDALILCTRMAVGKIRIAGCDIAINQDLKGLIPSTLVSRSFIIYQILSTKFKEIGTTVKGLQFVDFLNHPIWLPPYNEQIRISEKLDFILNQISY